MFYLYDDGDWRQIRMDLNNTRFVDSSIEIEQNGRKRAQQEMPLTKKYREREELLECDKRQRKITNRDHLSAWFQLRIVVIRPMSK